MLNLGWCAMKRSMSLLGCVMILWTRNEVVRAETMNTVPLSVAHAEQLMRENWPAMRAARYALDGASADLITASEAPNPQLSINSSAINYHAGVGSGALWNKQVDSVVRIDQQLERGSKRVLREKVARAAERAAAADYDDTLRNSKLALYQTYYELKYAQEAEDIARKLFELQQESLRTARLRLKSGDVASVDVARLEIEVSRAQGDLSTVQTARHVAQIALRQLLGETEKDSVLLASDEWPPLVTVHPDDVTTDQRPDVRAATARNEQAAANIELARAQQKRDVTIGVQFEHYPQGGSSPNSVGAGFSIPLFIRHHYQGELQRAAADHHIAEETLRATQLAAATEQAQVTAERIGARERLLQFQNSIVDKATSTAQAAEYAYSRGALNLTDLLDARRAMQSVLSDALSARLEYAKALMAWRTATELNVGTYAN